MKEMRECPLRGRMNSKSSIDRYRTKRRNEPPIGVRERLVPFLGEFFAVLARRNGTGTNRSTAMSYQPYGAPTPSLGGAPAPSVGLATLLLSSTTNPILSRTACCILGNLYPAYASLKSIEYMRVRDETHDATKWLMYWSVYGLFSAFETIALPSWITKTMPYPFLRLVFTLWLQVPRFSGAYRLTVEYLRPFLHRYYTYIDVGVEKAKDALRVEARAPILRALEDMCRRIPIVEWFMRYPDGSRYIKDSDG
jgi:receptor expression-enhancing protein 5/6